MQIILLKSAYKQIKCDICFIELHTHIVLSRALQDLIRNNSMFPSSEKNRLLGLNHKKLKTELANGARLSQLEEYLDGTRVFPVPIYVVHGDHEDVRWLLMPLAINSILTSFLLGPSH